MNILDYQNDIKQLLFNSFTTNRLSHAYIFEGEKGSGTKEVALYLAKLLLCTEANKPCGECDNCLRVEHGTHTNVIFINAIGDSIRKDQVISLIHEGQMSSLSDKNRLFIIEDAEKMNSAASNTLLKFLEEPTENNYVVLLTQNSKMLLDTIISRTQVLRFKPVNKQFIMDLLIKEKIDTDLSYLLSELYGNFEDALLAYKEGNTTNVYEMFKKIVLARASNKDIYLEYYLNRKLLTDSNSMIQLIEMLILFKREEMRYVEKHQTKHFKIFVNTIDYDNVTPADIARQIEYLNEASNQIKSHVNADLVWASLAQKL